MLGKQVIETTHYGFVTVREDNAAAALEVMSCYAVDPRWLIHLPPTMLPPETSARDSWLERPEEAVAYYATKGVETVVLQEKHMGSRALVLLARDADVARRRFAVEGHERGIVVTRTGRRFFSDHALEAAVLDRLDAGMVDAGLWDELAFDGVLWDAEILPWSLKAESLVRSQYAAVGAAAVAGLTAEGEALAAALARGLPVDELAAAATAWLDDAHRFRTAYNRYVAPFEGMDDLRIAHPSICWRRRARCTMISITSGTWLRRTGWRRWTRRWSPRPGTGAGTWATSHKSRTRSPGGRR